MFICQMTCLFCTQQGKAVSMATNDEKMTLANGAAPAIPVHPGSILGEELRARGIRQKDFAALIGMHAPHLSALIHGNRNFTPEIAAKIESGLPEIPAGFWLKMQARFQADKAHRQRRYSDLVDGYGGRPSSVPSVLMDPWSHPGRQRQVLLRIPEADRDFLRIFAERMGWELTED